MKRKANLTELFNQQGGHCAYCDKKMDITKTNTHDAPTRDHIQSKYHGGSNHPHNLVCACHECNTRKGSLPLSIFLSQLRKRHLRVIN
jgi:5-methylcytosine-specific restriction endonuclease McrA